MYLKERQLCLVLLIIPDIHEDLVVFFFLTCCLFCQFYVINVDNFHHLSPEYFRCWLLWVIRRQSNTSRGCFCVCPTRLRTRVCEPAHTWLPWKRSDTSCERRWRRWAERAGLCRCLIAVESGHWSSCCFLSSRRAACQQKKFKLSPIPVLKMFCCFLLMAQGMRGLLELVVWNDFRVSCAETPPVLSQRTCVPL